MNVLYLYCSLSVLAPLVGPDENKCFLSVMPFKNQSNAYCKVTICHTYTYVSLEDLQKHFTKEENLTCVLDYMMVFQNQKKFIFRNYTVLFRHVFEGLCYLKTQGIVHRDIKCKENFYGLKQLSISYLASNILVHQNCGCNSPLQCTCAGDGDVTYLLGDMDLLSLEDSENLTYTLDEWQKMAGHDPAGTIGMKPPEVCRTFSMTCVYETK